jgi:hypothetical protein
LVAELARRNPDSRQRAGALQVVQSPRVELVRLVDHPHHQLRLAGVHEFGDTARGLNLVDDPVPVPDGLDRHRRSPLTAFQEFA